MKREPILPVKTRQVFHNIEKEKPNLSGFVQVNAIPQKQSLKSKSHQLRSVTKTENISGNRNVKYVNQKQEQFHRLRRQTKIEENAKWSELLNKETENGDDQNYLQRIKQTNKAIDEAELELQNINMLMSTRKSATIPKRIQPTIEIKKVKTKMTKLLEEKNHKCARAVYSNTMDILTKALDKKLNVDQEKEKQRRRNKAQSKKLDQTINLMNEKLNEAQGKYFDNDYETNHITSIINKKPKYHSIKDIMKLENNSVRLSSMEASKLLQNDLENDLKKLRSSSPILNQTDEKMNVIYENLEFLQSEPFQDDFNDIKKQEKIAELKVRSRTPSNTPCILNTKTSSRITVETNIHKQGPKSGFKTLETISEIQPQNISFSTDSDSEYALEKLRSKCTRKPLLVGQNRPEITSIFADRESDYQTENQTLKKSRKILPTLPSNRTQSMSTSMSEETDSEHPLELQVKRSSFLRKEFGLGSEYDITKPLSKGLDFLLT